MPAFTSAPTGTALDRTSIKITWPRPTTAQSSYAPFYGAKYFQELGQFNVLQIRGSRGFSRDPVENFYAADGETTQFELNNFLDNSQFVQENPNIQLSRPIIAGFPYLLPKYSMPGSFSFIPEEDRLKPGVRLPLIQILWGSTAAARATYSQTAAYADTYSQVGVLPNSPPDSYFTFGVDRVFSSEEEVRRTSKTIRDSYYVIVNLISQNVEFFGIRPIPTPHKQFTSQPAHSWKALGRYTTSVRFIERDVNLIDRAGGRIFVRSISDPNIRSAEDAARTATVFFKKQGAQFRVSGKVDRDGLKAGYRLHVIHPAFGLSSSDEFVVRNIKCKQLGNDKVTEEPILEYNVTLGSNIGNYQEYSRAVRATTISAAGSIRPPSRVVISKLLSTTGGVSSSPLPNFLAPGELTDLVVNPQATSAVIAAGIPNRGNTSFMVYYRYRAASSGVWLIGAAQVVNSTETKITLAELTTSTDYIVQASLNIDFSLRLSRAFSTRASKQFRPPYFDEGRIIIRSINENISTGTNVGDAITATDPTGQDITYELSGGDSGLFEIDEDSGQVTTNTTIDYEDENEYRMTITATDVDSNETIAALTINVVNLNEDGELEFSTEFPRVNLNVTAELSDPDGRLDLIGTAWEWEHGTTNSGPWTTFRTEDGGLTDEVTLPSSTLNRYLRVRVEYTDAFGPGQIAEYVSSTTVKNISTSSLPPEFGAPYEFNVEENSDFDIIVGTVSANSPGGHTISYSLIGSGATNFDINSSGEILVAGSLDYETSTEYTFEARATANSNSTDVDVRVNILNVDEPPSRASIPTLIERTETSISIIYTTPDTTGPPVNSYLIQHINQRTGSVIVESTAVAQYTIDDLEPETGYAIKVAGVNPEGEGEYSSSLAATTKSIDTVTGSRTFELSVNLSRSGPGLSLEWTGALPFYDDYLTTSTGGYLQAFSLFVDVENETVNAQLNIGSTPFGTTSRQLVTAMEIYESAFTITQGNLSATLAGPDHVDNNVRDSGGPYSWQFDFDHGGRELANLISGAYHSNNPILVLRVSDGA